MLANEKSVMASQSPNRKRKAVTRDSPDLEEAAVYDELGNRPLNGVLFQSDDEVSDLDSDGQTDEEEKISGSGSEFDAGFEDLDSDEIPSEGEDQNEEDDFLKLKGLKEVKPFSNGTNTYSKDLQGFESLNGYKSSELDEEGDEDLRPNYTVTKDANGNPRYVYREIDPIYDSDDSDAPDETNTVGNIPLSFYDSYPHIGYDINGKKVMRPAKGAALDSLLDSIEIPEGWTGLTDPSTGNSLQLSREELEMVKSLTRNEAPGDGYDPYPEMLEVFSNKTEVMPLNAAPEPKRRFVPSKHEAKRVMKIVRAIREGRIQPYKAPSEQEEQDSDIQRYDIWADEASRPDHPMNVPAPKLPPPDYDESYHPPPEYLPNEAEKNAWQDEDEDGLKKDYLPSDHDALRKVPGYERFVKEKFERCLDLYLAPRIRRSKLNIDPESLLPKLPSPEELKPFPNRCETTFIGHKGRVRSVAITSHGEYLASGGDDGTVRVWNLMDGRLLWNVSLSPDEAVHVVRWRPNMDSFILAAACGEHVYLMVPPLPSQGHIMKPLDDSQNVISDSHDLLNAGWEARRSRSASSDDTVSGRAEPAQWSKPERHLQEQGVLVKITVRSSVKVIAWHRKGEYFSTVAPRGQSNAIAIHTLSKHLTQLPFRRLKGLPQSVQFHSSKPIFFVSTQRTIRSYDLIKQQLLKILQPGAKWISTFDVHPGGDNLIVGTYDRRLLWMDMDLSTRPYKTLRYHQKAIRAARYHGRYPLFADGSDDGTLQIFHGKVVGDLMENASIVPLKVLRGHKVENGLGVLDLDWHPTSPWCVSAGADGTCRLWTD